jgi:ubiquinone biosynthesis protein UbiJ
LENKKIDLEIELKQKSEEIDTLQFNNNRLSKRVENLMEDLNSQVLKFFTR